MKHQTIALVGRVNVGKSTLFNKLIEERKALVSDEAGTTRTNNEGLILWRGKTVRVIDTGGLTFDESVPFETDIMAQSAAALKRADVILFITDAQSGVLIQEKELAKRLRKYKKKPILLVANKTDSPRIANEIDLRDWLALGFGEPFFVSATTGRGIGDLLDAVNTLLPDEPREEEADDTTPAPTIRVSLLGKPNVGKSSLFNKLIGEDKAIVSDIPHTTREPNDTLVLYEDRPIVFIDTAGMRRKAKVAGKLEQIGISKTILAIESSDIVLFVLDAKEDISHQDKELGSLLERRGKSVIILMNKWDLADDNSDQARNAVVELVRKQFPHLDFAPMVFVSGKTGYKVHQIFPLLVTIAQARQTSVANRGLETFLEAVVKEHRPSRGKGTRHPEIRFMRQIGTSPPVMEIMVKFRTSLHHSYVRFLEHKLREWFDFTGTPIIIRVSKQKR